MIPSRTHLFRKVTIVGVGLIGGSLGKAIKHHRLAREVVGYSRKPETAAAAVKAGAVDQGTHDIKKAVSYADLVVLAVPVSAIIESMTSIAPALRRNTIVTDVGSTKQSIVQASRTHLPNPAMFVGSHPLAGSEKRGVEHARADFFQGSLCILTPTAETHKGAVERLRRLWGKVGARVESVSPEEHDRSLAFVSHLPHVLAYALMSAVPDEALKFASSGLKDSTRIAGSSPELWTEICLENPKNILRGIDETVKVLAGLRKAIVTQDNKTILNQFRRAQSRRGGLGS